MSKSTDRRVAAQRGVVRYDWKAKGMKVRKIGDWVLATDYDTLEAENSSLGEWWNTKYLAMVHLAAKYRHEAKDRNQRGEELLTHARELREALDDFSWDNRTPLTKKLLALTAYLEDA